MKMKNKLRQIGIFLVVAGFLLVGVQAGIALPQDRLPQPTENAGWLYVGGGGPGNYTKIQSAIDAAVDGDTVYVFPGTYHETLNIAVSLRLIGAGRDVTTIFGNALNATVEIARQNVVVQGFTIKNDGTQVGIESTTSSSQHTFSDNIITMTSYGIRLYYSSFNQIKRNLFYDNTHSGVYMEVGQNDTVFNNEFYNNTDEAIYMTGSGKVTIDRNSIHNNWIGIHAFRDNGNMIRNNVIVSNSYGIKLTGLLTQNSNFNTVSRNRINYNTICGIEIDHSQGNVIEFNEIRGNGIGIQFTITALNRVKNNNITMSTDLGLMFSFSVGDLIIGNNIDNTQDRLVLMQIGAGIVIAPNNWWGSTQWPLRRMRPLYGWAWIIPWRMNPFDFNVGPVV